MKQRSAIAVRVTSSIDRASTVCICRADGQDTARRRPFDCNGRHIYLRGKQISMVRNCKRVGWSLSMRRAKQSIRLKVVPKCVDGDIFYRTNRGTYLL